MKRPLAALFVIVVAVAALRPILSSSESVTEVAGTRAYRAQNSASEENHGNRPDQPPGLAKKETTTTPVAVVVTTAAITTSTAAITTTAPIITTTASTVTTTLPPSTTVATLAPTTTTAQPVTSTTATPTTTAAVGVPAGAITISPGQNVQQVVNGSPAGSTFYLLAGMHSGQQVTPRDGDKFIGAAGAVMSGNGSTSYAFRSSAKNVTIRGLVIEKYNNPAQSGAIQGYGSGWVIEQNEIRENSGAGIHFASGARIVGNRIHHNRQAGILGNGASNAVVENNEIAFNNYLDQYDYGWEAGGTKFVKTSNLVVRGNWVHDNHGPGLWTDIDNVGTLYENNTVTNNYGPGIFHEISYQAVIRSNLVDGNAFPFYSGGILVANSRDVEVYGNTLRNNDGGIFAIEDNRGTGALGALQVWNLWVHDNSVTQSNGSTGIRNNAGVPDLYTTRNNRFDRNNYSSSDPTPFYWNNAEKSFSDWQATGNDLGGSMS